MKNWDNAKEIKKSVCLFLTLLCYKIMWGMMNISHKYLKRKFSNHEDKIVGPLRLLHYKVHDLDRFSKIVDMCLEFLQLDFFQYFRTSRCLHQQGTLVHVYQATHEILPCFSANCSHCLQGISVRRMMQPNAKVSQQW